MTAITITKTGRALAWKLNPYLGTTTYIQETCSLICRLAKTYGRYQVDACNRQLSNRELKREQQLQDRIIDLIGQLPHTDEGPILPNVSGDPRGYTVKLVLPPCYRAGDTWGGWEEGLFVPNS